MATMGIKYSTGATKAKNATTAIAAIRTEDTALACRTASPSPARDSSLRRTMSETNCVRAKIIAKITKDTALRPNAAHTPAQ